MDSWMDGCLPACLPAKLVIHIAILSTSHYTFRLFDTPNQPNQQPNQTKCHSHSRPTTPGLLLFSPAGRGAKRVPLPAV